MKSNVSSTPEAEAWLNQFDTQDRPTAKLLLNKLQIIPSNQVFQSIEFEIGNRLNRIQTPAMLVPVTPSTSQPQNSSLFPSLQGSEGHISSICKTLVKNHPDKLFEPSNISCLKEKQCRSIIFIDDNSGSGENICNYLKSCWDNPTFGKTLKSWHSYHLLEFIILAYSITDHARGEITKNKWVDSIIPVHKTPTIWSEFKNSDLIKIEQLCKNYPKGSALPLGYQNIGSLMAFSHSAPDTLPAVFIESNSKWSPLFPNRRIPQALQAGTFSIKASGATKSPISLVRINILKLIKSTGDVSTEFCNSLGIDVLELEGHLQFLRKKGLIKGVALTKDGINEIKQFKKKPSFFIGNVLKWTP